VLAAQASRTPAQTARVLSEKHSSPKLFQTVLGPHFYDPGDEPKIYHLLYDTAQEASTFDHDAKDHWQRPRPAVAHPDVVHPVYAESGLAYPSGHTTGAYACALILAQIYPEKKTALLERAAEIAHDRIIGGVHYPSDIVAGEQLGRAVAAALLANPAFQHELAAAKEEARKLTAR
jgi:acid phosphatase (class A)